MNQKVSDAAFVGTMDNFSDTKSVLATLNSYSMALWNIYRSNEEIFLSVCAALLLLIVLVVMFMVSRRRIKSTDKVPLIETDSEVDIDSKRLILHV